MKLTYALLFALLTVIYLVVKNAWPDVPAIDLNVTAGFAIYILAKFGIEVLEPPVRAFFVKRGFKSFIRG